MKQLKAINILENENVFDSDYLSYNRHIDISGAIREIEDLQNENKSLVKTLEKYNEEMIELRKQNQDLLNTIIEAQKVIKNVLENNK